MLSNYFADITLKNLIYHTSVGVCSLMVLICHGYFRLPVKNLGKSSI